MDNAFWEGFHKEAASNTIYSEIADHVRPMLQKAPTAAVKGIGQHLGDAWKATKKNVSAGYQDVKKHISASPRGAAYAAGGAALAAGGAGYAAGKKKDPMQNYYG
jgi:hypothetical protein